VRQNALVMHVHITNLDVGFHGRASKLLPEAYLWQFRQITKATLGGKESGGRGLWLVERRRIGAGDGLERTVDPLFPPTAALRTDGSALVSVELWPRLRAGAIWYLDTTTVRFADDEAEAAVVTCVAGAIVFIAPGQSEQAFPTTARAPFTHYTRLSALRTATPGFPLSNQCSASQTAPQMAKLTSTTATANAKSSRRPPCSVLELLCVTAGPLCQGREASRLLRAGTLLRVATRFELGRQILISFRERQTGHATRIGLGQRGSFLPPGLSTPAIFRRIPFLGHVASL
jgi:hypothetical protein